MKVGDSELITRFLDGDLQALATVDGWILGAAYPFRRRLPDDSWDDSLQDLRLELTRLLKEGKFRGESSLRTYLSRVVSHYCLNRLRAHRRWHWTELEDAEVPANGRPGTPGPERAVSRDLLLRVLGEMSEECRKLWALIVEGWSYREISLRLGVSEGALRVRALRCRQKAMAMRENLEST